MNPKERMRQAMCGEATDRPPCICPGGMMNMITTDLMELCNIRWPEAHTDARMMVALAEANYRNGCFENVGVPFCMTIEAESMGPKLFEEYTVKYNNMIWDALPKEKMGSIMHICGQMRNVYPKVNLIHADVLSFDSCVPMSEARKYLDQRVLMGNVSTWALEFGKPDKVKQLAVKCWKDGSGIISPACGLGTRSPIENIRAIKEGILEVTDVI